MLMHPQVASVVGQVTEDRWGQVLQTPHAYGVVEVYSSIGVARERGIAVLTELTKVFETPPTSLSELTHVADRVMADDIVSMILLVPVGMTMYMVSRGRGRVYLKRESKLAILLEASQALSGDLKAGDVVIVATAGFVRTLTSEEIANVFDHLTPVEVAEKLTMKIHEKEGGDGGAALIFQIGEVPIVVDEQKNTEEILAHPAPVAPSVRFHRAKAFGRLVGRKVTNTHQRAFLRRVITKVRGVPYLSTRHLVLYVVVVLFAVSVILGILHTRSVQTTSALSNTLTEAQHSFDEGMALLDLNPVKGRQRLTQAKDLLAPIVSRKLRSDDGQKATHLYGEVIDNLTRSMHITHVIPDMFFDVSLLKKGAIASDISLFEDTIGILDVSGKTVFAVGAQSKSGAIVGGGESFTGSAHIAAYGDKLYVWTPKGIHMVRLSDQKTVQNVIPISDQWGTISDMAAFGGNIYLLDTQKNRIWKYVATEKGFSELFEYLNPDTLPVLTKTTNMVIDGSVWLGSTTGDVTRFTAGKENPLTLQGEDTPLGNTLEVYTNDANKMVYVLDSDHHRVVIFDKDGLYMAQYIWDNDLRVSEILASEVLKKLYLLADGKLYTISLQ
jgi:hypothetical protein